MDPNGSNGAFCSFHSIHVCSKYIIHEPIAVNGDHSITFIHVLITCISTAIPGWYLHLLSLVSKTMPSTVTRFRSCQGPSAHLDKDTCCHLAKLKYIEIQEGHHQPRLKSPSPWPRSLVHRQTTKLARSLTKVSPEKKGQILSCRKKWEESNQS